MPFIHPKGSPSSQIWVILDTPISTDIPKGFILSGGMGFMFDKMMSDAGIRDYYVTCRRPDTDDPKSFRIVESELNQYKPPFIITVGEAGEFFCKILSNEGKGKKLAKSSELFKYSGSLLSSDSFLSYPHYLMPMLDLRQIVSDWKERNIVTYFDLQKLRVELEYFKKHGKLQPLPQRNIHYQDMTLEVLIEKHFAQLRNAPILSVDIESVYTKRDSVFAPHPGYITTVGIADSSSYGISFNLFRDSSKECVVLWRELDRLLSSKMILGQNFYEFDAPRLRAMGIDISKKNIIDTKIRHHILWPELSHTLQFMTRQYTREIYYKDEGKAWNMKNMAKLRRYNCLDVCVTYEVYAQQEEEFAERKEIA
jgi:hypothetical protein